MEQLKFDELLIMSIEGYHVYDKSKASSKGEIMKDNTWYQQEKI